MTQLDRALITAIQQLTAFPGLHYTERQLYYEVCRILQPVPGLGNQHAKWAIAVGLIPSLLTWAVLRRLRWAGLLAGATLGTVAALYGMRRVPYTLSLPVMYTRFAEALDNHCTHYGSPVGLLTVKRPPPLPPETREPDLLDYGVSRLLVCQNSAVVEMLLANDFHIELACPVLTVMEATPLPEPLLTMLSRTPDAHVYFLHDAGAGGVSIIPSLRQQMNLPPAISLTAMGLRPTHAKRLHLFAYQKPLAQNTPASTKRPASAKRHWPYYLSKRERVWLEAGRQAEVEAVPPVRLLRVLRRMMLDAGKPQFKWPNLVEEREVGFMTWPEQ
jgi:hypothetical protein